MATGYASCFFDLVLGCCSRAACQAGMNGDTFSIKPPKGSSKMFAATSKGLPYQRIVFLEY